MKTGDAPPSLAPGGMERLVVQLAQDAIRSWGQGNGRLRPWELGWKEGHSGLAPGMSRCPQPHATPSRGWPRRQSAWPAA